MSKHNPGAAGPPPRRRTVDLTVLQYPNTGGSTTRSTCVESPARRNDPAQSIV